MSDDLAPGAHGGSPERLTLRTSDDVELPAELAVADEPVAIAVTCHPHPMYGGSMHANVVDALFRALPESGVSVLRFNFRGANGAGGTHDGGDRERLDVVAAIEEARRRQPTGPLVLAGYSFGADVSLAVDHEAVAGWLAVAPPLRIVDSAEMAALGDPRPTRVLVAAHDQFRPPDEAAELLASATNSTHEVVDGADHFFAVGLPHVVRAARALLAELVDDPGS